MDSITLLHNTKGMPLVHIKELGRQIVGEEPEASFPDTCSYCSLRNRQTTNS